MTDMVGRVGHGGFCPLCLACPALSQFARFVQYGRFITIKYDKSLLVTNRAQRTIRTFPDTYDFMDDFLRHLSDLPQFVRPSLSVFVGNVVQCPAFWTNRIVVIGLDMSDFTPFASRGSDMPRNVRFVRIADFVVVLGGTRANRTFMDDRSSSAQTGHSARFGGCGQIAQSPHKGVNSTKETNMADLVITDKMVETATIWGKADKAAATSASRTIVPTLSLWTEWANQDGTRTTDKSGRITRTWTIETQRTIADKSGRSVSTVDKMLKAGNRLILDFSDVWVISDKGDYLLVPDKSDNLDNPDKWVKWVQGGANALIAHLSGITGRKANNAPNPANDTPPPNSDKSDESAQTGTKQEKTPEPDKKDESPKADEPVNSDKADNPAKADKHDKTAFEAVSAAIGTIRDNMGQITQDERNWAFSAIQDILEKNGMTVITSRSHI